MAADDDLRIAGESLVAWFSRTFDDLRAMNRDLCEMLEAASASDDDVARVARAGRDRCKGRVRDFLRDHPRVNGAGVIFSRSALGDGKGVIEWWVRDGKDGLARYQFEVNPLGQRFYDYEKLEWFMVSFRSGQQWLTGPYIDYLGVEEYVVTLTTRTELHGRPVGVTGLDITVSDLERELLPMLRAARRPALLLNSHGAVLVSTASRYSAGDLVPEGVAGFSAVPLVSADVQITLLVADENDGRS